MSQTIQPEESSLNDVIRVSWGLVAQRLCVRNGLTPEEAARYATEQDPPGTEMNEWTVSTGDLAENQPCETYPAARYHLVVNC